MRNVWQWISSWWVTWRLKRDNPGLHEFLKNYSYDPGDFEEVPGHPGLRVHRDSLERMRKLGEDS